MARFGVGWDYDDPDARIIEWSSDLSQQYLSSITHEEFIEFARVFMQDPTLKYDVIGELFEGPEGEYEDNNYYYHRYFIGEDAITNFIHSYMTEKTIEEILKDPTLLLSTALQLGSKQSVDDILQLPIPDELKRRVLLGRSLAQCQNPETADPQNLRIIAGQLGLNIPTSDNPISLCYAFRNAWQKFT
jgi:hypothetical protein